MRNRAVFFLLVMCSGLNASERKSFKEAKEPLTASNAAAAERARAMRHAQFERIRAQHARLGDINATYREYRLRDMHNENNRQWNVWSCYLMLCAAVS